MSDERIHYRPAVAEDWPTIKALLTANDLPTVGERGRWTLFLVALHASEMVGCAALEKYETSGLLRSVAVAKDWRGRGIARSLTLRLLDHARAEGLVNVTLLTTTAAEYFPRLGFGSIARETTPDAIQDSVEFRDACPASATVMTLALG